jgi:hypothetical protein
MTFDRSSPKTAMYTSADLWQADGPGTEILGPVQTAQRGFALRPCPWVAAHQLQVMEDRETLVDPNRPCQRPKASGVPDVTWQTGRDHAGTNDTDLRPGVTFPVQRRVAAVGLVLLLVLAGHVAL